MRSKVIIFITGAALFLNGLLPKKGMAQDVSLQKLERDFKTLPGFSRQYIGPLFWLHGTETKKQLEMSVAVAAAGGNGSLTAESRPHNDWLGEGWYRDLGIVLEAAKKNNVKMWIFDERWFPSQGVDWKVPPKYAAKRLQATAVDVEGETTFEANGYSGENYIAAIAGLLNADGTIDGNTLTDIKDQITNGNLCWKAPAGKWKIMKFTYVPAPGASVRQGQELLVDGASKDCVNWFLNTVYQPHYDHFKADFGKAIQGFFYDEPETPGDWGTELNPVLKEFNVDWKKAYVAYKFKLAGEDQDAAKYQYLDAFAEAWGRTMYGGMTKWGEEHGGVRSIGHYWEHGGRYLDKNVCAGDMFRLDKYSSMGGIDAVVKQFVWGKRVTTDSFTYQTPKIASSISHVYNKKDDLASVEIFGNRGQDLTYPEMKWWADHMFVSGVNFLIPHSFNPRAPKDVDNPPYFFMGDYEPRWPLYKIFASYTSRLNMMLTGGTHDAPVALLHFGNAKQVGKAVTFENMASSLQDALYDCDLLPFEVFEKNVTLKDQQLKLYGESYKILIVPPVEVIPYSTLVKIREFYKAGGIIVGYGFLPSKSGTIGYNSGDVKTITDDVWGSDIQPGFSGKANTAGGRSYLLPVKPTPEQLQQVLAGDAGIHPSLEVVKGKTDNWLHVLHRVKSGRDIFFVTNQNITPESRTYTFKIKARGIPQCWDAMRNEITNIPYKRDGEFVQTTIAMQPNESILIVFNDIKQKLPLREQAAQREIVIMPDAHKIKPQTPQRMVGMIDIEHVKGASWIWYPEAENTLYKGATGTRYFRKKITLNENIKIANAALVAIGNSSIEVYVNGDLVKSSNIDRDKGVIEKDIKELLHPGANELAIAATNKKILQAGMLCKLNITYENGSGQTEISNQSWKVSNLLTDGWQNTGYDDSKWMQSANMGATDFKAYFDYLYTFSPDKLDVYFGNCTIPKNLDFNKYNVYLEADDIAPEEAGSVKINNRSAGGFIGKPLRLEVSKFLKAGINTITIAPFSPQYVKLILNKKSD